MNKVLFFGSGTDADQMMVKLKEYAGYYEDHILCFLDNDNTKWGLQLYGYDIKSPDMIRYIDYDLIIISSLKYKSEIIKQLCQKYFIEEMKILDWKQYIRTINIRSQYLKYLSVIGDKGKKSPIDTSNMVIYTVVEGGYDTLKDPEIIEKNTDYICFTDDRNIKSGVWDVKYIDPPVDKNFAKDIRKYKILSHRYFNNYTVSVWIDATYRIKRDIREFISKYSRESAFLCFPHADRMCIYEECAEAISLMKASPVDLIKQCADYINDGFPALNGLYYGGILIRDPRDEKLSECMEQWWIQINKYSLRDQISLPYVLWKQKFIPDICDLSVYENPWFEYSVHNAGHWRSAR